MKAIHQVPVPNQVLEICRRKGDAVPPNHGFQGVVVADTMIEDPDDPNVAIGESRRRVICSLYDKRLSGRRHQVGLLPEFRYVVIGLFC